MSYSKMTEYKIMPEESFKIIRNCSGCRCKKIYHSTDHFRVNANGNRLDVWLIFQCERCRHIYNLTIYERVNPLDISSEEYERFLENDKNLALYYGSNKHLFIKNKAEIAWDKIMFRLECITGQNKSAEPKIVQAGESIVIYNPFGLKIRSEKLAAEVLHITRNKVRELEKHGLIELRRECVEQKLEILIKKDMF